MKGKFIFIITQFFLVPMMAQVPFDAQICTWENDKQGAISITFDDASYGQYEYAFPTLEKYKIKATFSLVGEWTHEKPTYSAEPGFFDIKKMGWQQLNILKNAGHEIAAHGFVHQKYNKHLPKDSLIIQMQKIKNLIEDKLGAPIYTLHYPYSATSPNIIDAAKTTGFLFGRTYDDKINPTSPENMNRLVSKAILNNSLPDTLQLENWIETAQNKWLIIMYHHLFIPSSKEMKILESHKVEHTYSLYPDVFDKQMSIISHSNYMVAPLATIGKYITERNNTTLEFRKFCNKLTIKTTTSLNKQIYNIPLTIKINTPWKKVQVKGSQNEGIYNVENDQFLIHIIPGNTVIIKKKK